MRTLIIAIAGTSPTYLFEMNEMDNCYAAITSPNESYPPLSQNGISAFLVHRLAKDYRAVCRFTAESGRSVKYKASGAIFSNHLGAVDLEIQSIAPGQFGLSRRAFTIWQNNTENLYTLMSIPVEETLHYQLGKATDREIAASMKNHPPENLSAAQRLAEEWMAVEESVVGGLVNRLLESYCSLHHMAIPASIPGDSGRPLPPLHQYRYRDRGIQLVENLGFQEALATVYGKPLHVQGSAVPADRMHDSRGTCRDSQASLRSTVRSILMGYHPRYPD